jgi:hypothetical protein
MSQNPVTQPDPATCAQREANAPERGPILSVDPDRTTGPPAEAKPPFTRPAKDKFTRACKTCTSPNVAEIEALASMGLDNSAIARRFGVSMLSVRNHVRRHISADRWARMQAKSYFGRDDVTTAEHLQRLRDRERDSLLVRLAAQRADLNALTKSEIPRIQIAAHNALIKLHELVARVLGEIQTGTSVSIDNRSVHIGSNDILELKNIVERALADYPAARQKLLNALATSA